MCGTNFGSGAKISTHTLTWSVTPFKIQKENIVYNFNSHAHVERDLSLFNPFGQSWNFNSHAHVERDFDLKCSLMLSGIFQLTRSRGA